MVLLHSSLQRAQPPAHRHAAPVRLLAGGKQPIIVSGLDGVLVNSEPATTRCAWLAACELWPDVMDKAAGVPANKAGVRRSWVNYDWEQLTGEAEDGMPAWLEAKLRQLRPVTGSNYETILLARLCADEAVAASSSSRGSRPLSVGEIEGGWGGGLRHMLMARYGTGKQELCEAHEGVSEAWWKADPKGWLAANPLYDGAAAALRRALEEQRSRVVVLSRREPWETRALLNDAAGAPAAELVDPDTWRGATKADALATLRRAHPDAPMRYVDDSARTVIACAADSRLLPVGLHFASYGYATAAQRARTGTVPRLRVLDTSEQLAEVCDWSES